MLVEIWKGLWIEDEVGGQDFGRKFERLGVLGCCLDM